MPVSELRDQKFKAVVLTTHVQLVYKMPFVCVCVSLIKQQCVISHTIRQTEIPALLHSWVTNTRSVTTFSPQKKLLLLIFS